MLATPEYIITIADSFVYCFFIITEINAPWVWRYHRMLDLQ